MFITRIGWNSKAVINGDVQQTDLPHSARGGLEQFIDRLYDIDGVGMAKLTEEDIIRNDIISKILKALHD